MLLFVLLLKDELQAMVIEREETIVGLRKEVETLSAKLAAKDFVKEVSLWRRTHTMHTPLSVPTTRAYGPVGTDKRTCIPNDHSLLTPHNKLRPPSP